MAGLVQQPQRFTHEEWTYSNNLKYRSAEKEREISQGLQNECDRFIEETAKRTEKTLKDVEKKFDQRIANIKYWKSEVNKKLQDITEETEILDEYFVRLRKTLEATEEPLHFAQQCLLSRERRTGIDLVHDDAQKELIKEIEIIKGAQAILQRTIEQAKEQLRLNRKVIYNLKKDSSDKLQAQQLDEYALSLKPTDDSLSGSTQLPKIVPHSFTPEEWQTFSINSIENGDRQLQNSHELRSIIDGVIQQVAADIKRQIEATNRALNKRISETRSSKAKLEEHLSAVIKEISDIEDTLHQLEKAIKDKDGILRLAGTRLGIRRERPNVELCRDPADFRLIQEVEEIKRDIEQLKQRLHAAHASLKALLRRQLDLEEEIQIKAATLFIDEVQCMGIRGSIKFTAF
ncbi:Tektin-1 isoform 2 [Schistosoma japonicum]|uniref:Tektin n=2 Tax=Schistosoma japonicum TaxID=6182 RepID=A0A4Z2DU15_SCHJA|nr:Tektin-1 isoform 2 [Schistosoma japonicum]